MPDEELEIEISPTGEVTMRTHGIKGSACMDYADLMVQIVGLEQSRQTTPEFYENVEHTVQHRLNVKQQR